MLFRSDDLYLNSKKCKYSFVSSAHVIFDIPLDNCGTTHNTSANYITYFNSINWLRKAGTRNRVISRDLVVSIPFQCSYAKKQILSVVSFSPRRKIVVTSDGKKLSFLYIYVGVFV